MIVVIAIGVIAAAAIGACLRAYLGLVLNREIFPYGTFAANLIASFTLGLLSTAGPEWNTVIGIGALGALSTWSTVANEAAQMARSNQGGMAILYLVAMTTTGVLAAWTGIQITV